MGLAKGRGPVLGLDAEGSGAGPPGTLSLGDSQGAQSLRPAWTQALCSGRDGFSRFPKSARTDGEGPRRISSPTHPSLGYLVAKAKLSATSPS